MKKRTAKEIKKQIEGLKKMKKTLPEFSFFGDNNWDGIDAQLDVLEGMKEAEDFEDDDEIYSLASQAEEWLNGERDEDLFE